MITHDHELFEKYDWDMTYSEHGLDFERGLISEPKFLFMSLWYEVRWINFKRYKELHCLLSTGSGYKITGGVYVERYIFFDEVLKHIQENEK